MAGPTREERAIADAQVQAAATAVVVHERSLEKMILRAPADSVDSVVADPEREPAGVHFA